jgi:TRAP-type C4-dicarboxylate transport system substrate-binding protein
MLKRGKFLTLFGSILLIVILVGFALAPSAKPAAAPEPAKTFHWRFAIYDPSLSTVAGLGHVKMAKAIFERSGGRLQIDVSPAGVLGYSGFVHHRVTGQGLLEMGETVSAAVIEVPAFGAFSHVWLFKNAEDALKGWNAVKPELDKAAATFNTKVLAAVFRPPDMLHTTKRPFPTLESFKGAKIRSWHPLLSDWLKEVGAVPMVIPYAERYTSLATGVVEGNFASPVSQIDTKDYEVCKYTHTWLGSVPIYVTFVNLGAYSALPPDLQKILTEEAAKMESEVTKKFLVPGAVEAINRLRGFGVTIVEVSPEEIAKGMLAGKAVQERWMAKVGSEGRAVMEKVRKAIGY